MAVSGFTAVKEKAEKPIDLVTWMASHPVVVLAPKRSYVVREEYDGPREMREYDITDCLKRIAEDGASKAGARQLLDATLKSMYDRGGAQRSDAAASRSGQGESSPFTYSIEGTKLSVAQITVESRFLSANRDLVSELGISWQFLEAFLSEREARFPAAGGDGAPVVRVEARVDEYLPLVVATLDKEQTKRLIENLNVGEDGSPRQRQRATHHYCSSRNAT